MNRLTNIKLVAIPFTDHVVGSVGKVMPFVRVKV